MRKFALLIVVAMLVVGCGPPTNTPDAGRGAPYLGTWDLSANATLSLLTPDGGTEPRACTYEWTFELAPTEQTPVENPGSLVPAGTTQLLPGRKRARSASTNTENRHVNALSASTNCCSVGASSNVHS